MLKYILLLALIFLTGCHSIFDTALEKKIDEQSRQTQLLLTKVAQLEAAQKENNKLISDYLSLTKNELQQNKQKKELLSQQLPTKKQVIGQIETIYLNPPKINLPARIDTGATSSSIHAINIQPFERNGKDWIKFDIVYEDKTYHVETKLIKYIKVVQSSTKTAQKRAVVELELTMGKIVQNTLFTVTDRSHMSYPVLIGRNALKDLLVVDVAKKNTLTPSNKKEP
ncbi:ATP-dependent zinc protease [Candidatus Marinarcus aquaticus]|uniref:Retropepsin-like aspartic endopeptidase domain-containing protein n=1 Tax=Candidatus Marinarcus aquaticus TaxID=2044504 RepID=A0A4Q0XNZ9_9BACT|nr:ATP-dependent zinc protease [Candidatus Marinarcus aquaticus]RXJ54493.1 hypothetical protein CRV04_11925 [Candidatus Marinarcus aquaticus]